MSNVFSIGDARPTSVLVLRDGRYVQVPVEKVLPEEWRRLAKEQERLAASFPRCAVGAGGNHERCASHYACSTRARWHQRRAEWLRSRVGEG